MAENLEQRAESQDFDTQHAIKLAAELMDGDVGTKVDNFSEAVDYLLSTNIFDKLDLVALGPNQLTQALILAYAVTKFLGEHADKVPSNKIKDLVRLMKLVKSDHLERQVRLYQQTSDLSTLYHGVVVGAEFPINRPIAQDTEIFIGPDESLPAAETKQQRRYLGSMKTPEELGAYLSNFNLTPDQKLDCIGEHLLGLMGVFDNAADEIHSSNDLARLLKTVQVLTRPMLVSGVDGMKDAYRIYFENSDNIMAQYMISNFGIDRSVLSNPIQVTKYLRTRLTDRMFDDLTMEFAIHGTSELYATTVKALDDMVNAAEMADSMKDSDWRTPINSG